MINHLEHRTITAFPKIQDLAIPWVNLTSVCMDVYVWGSVGSFEGKGNGRLCVYLLSFSVVNWRSVYLSEVQVRRKDLFYFFKKPLAH